MQHTLTDVITHISDSDEVLIFGHRNPDGDALGSTLALSQVFTQIGIKNQVVMPNAFPVSFSWLPHSGNILNFDDHPGEISKLVKASKWFFFLDFNDPKRMGKMFEALDFDLSRAVIIDHHPYPSDEVAYLFSDTSRSSTCELVYKLVIEAQLKAHVNKDVATCIFTGLITDTGGFNHNSASADFFNTIAGLIELGADKDAIFQKVFHTQNESRFRLLGEILHKHIDLNYDLGVAIMWLGAAELKKHNFQMGDTEGFVNLPLSLSGINKSVLVMEMKDEIKLSFRSRNGFSINQFATKYFNGGGHKNAAGGHTHESFEDTIQKLRNHLNEL